MTTAQERYRALVRTRLAPGLRSLGFKGSGRTYELPSETHWALLGLQASQWSDASELRFTVNLLAVPRGVWAQESARRGLGPRPNPNVLPGGFAWCSRLGPLLPGGEDRWWTVRAADDGAEVAQDVLAAVETYGLPVLRSQVAPGRGTGADPQAAPRR